MASTTTTPLPHTATPPPKGPKKNAKPAKGALFADPEDQVPLPPSPKPDAQTFFAYWAEIEAKWPKRTMAYVYRGWPRIVRKEDKPSNIHAGGFFTYDWLSETFGTGEYLIMLNDPYRQPRSQQQLCQCVVRISDPTRPPVLDPAELDMNWKDNQQFIAQLRMQGVKLPGDESLPPSVTTALEAISKRGAEPDHSQRQTADLLNQTFATLMQNTLDPTKQLKQLESLLALARPADTGSHLAPILAMLQQLIAQQQEQNRATLQALTAIEKPAAAAPPPEDPLTGRLKELMVDRFMAEIENPQPTTPPDASPWVMVLAPLLAKGLDIAGAFVSAYATKTMTEAQTPPPPPIMAPPAAQLYRPQPAANPQPQSQQPTAQPETEEGAPPDMFSTAMILNAIRPQLIAAFQQNWNGLQFRDEMIRLYGEVIYSQVVHRPNADQGIIEAISKDAELRPLYTAQPDRIRKFVEEFLSDEEQTKQAEPKRKRQP